MAWLDAGAPVRPDRNVLAVGSGKEALRQILKTDFALILLDIRMPEMDGFETATLIRKLKRSRHTPIIFLTAALEDAQSIFRGYESAPWIHPEAGEPRHPEVEGGGICRSVYEER